MTSYFKEIFKVLGIIGVIILLMIISIIVIFICSKIYYNYNASKIENIFDTQKYNKFCLVSSYVYPKEGYLTINEEKIYVKNEWPNSMGDDGLFYVIFIDDKEKAGKIIKTTRKASPNLFDPNYKRAFAHYCKSIE